MKDKFQVISLWNQNEKKETYRDKISAIPLLTFIKGNKKEVLKKYRRIRKDFLEINPKGKIYLVEVIEE
ncbi:MAG: hypothetical protein ABIH79_01100 [archaeon]